MGCLAPIPAVRNGREIKLHPARHTPGEPLTIPCGRCINCTARERRGWALRGRLEAAEWEHVTFATLTLDSDSYGPNLQLRHLQLFMKRLRRQLDGLHDKHGLKRKLKYFACGEYGETYGRPHYHAILYGVHHEHDAELVDWCWNGTETSGIAQTLRADIGGIHYVTGYQLKKLNEPEHAYEYGIWERLDRKTGEISYGRTKNYWLKPPFRVMSKRPAIGATVAAKHAARFKHYAVLDGAKIAAPRYFKRKYEEQASTTELAEYKEEKERMGMERAREEYARTEHLTREELEEDFKRGIKAREEIAEHALRRQKDSRKYG